MHCVEFSKALNDHLVPAWTNIKDRIDLAGWVCATRAVVVGNGVQSHTLSLTVAATFATYNS